MDKAITSVERGEVSIRKASVLFDVPRSTLHDRITGKVAFEAKPGPTPYLSMQEEEELASFLFLSAKIGYPYTRKKVLHIVQQIIDDKGVMGHVTNGWWERFKERHPNVVLKTAAPLSNARAIAADRDVIERYYDLLEDTLRHNNLFDKANCIFNCDETGLPLCPKTLKIVTVKGARNPSSITGDSKSQITILGCANAAGYAIPPFVIFNRETFNKELCTGEVPGTIYGTSANGWMNRSLFTKWFLNHFLTYAPKIRPIILLMDGHSTHYCPDLIKQAATEKVILFVLPPHSTHITQPLDNGCYSPLKMHWRQVCHDFYSKHPGSVVTVYDFSELFSAAWLAAMTGKNIISSFRNTGICPFNRFAIDIPDQSYKSFKPETLCQQTGLAHIPLYSAGRRYTSTPVKSCNSDEDYTPGDCSRSLHDYDKSDDDYFADESPQTALVLEPTSTSLSKYLVTPKQVRTSKPSIKRIKSCGLVMTSMDIAEALERKEKEKEEKEKERLQKRSAKLSSKKSELTIKHNHIVYYPD